MPAPPFAAPEMVVGDPIAGLAPGKVHCVHFCYGDLVSQQRLLRLQRACGAEVAITTVVGVSDAVDREGLVGMLTEDEAIVDYPIVFDAGNVLRAAWVEAAAAVLPVVFLVDAAGTLAWWGPGEFSSIVVPQVLAGGADPQALKGATDAARRQYWASWKAADHAPAFAVPLLEALLATWPSLAGWAVPDIYRRLALGDGKAPEHARRLQVRLCQQLSADEDVRALLDLADSIVEPECPVGGDAAIAERAALRAVQLTGAKDACALETLARVHWVRGDSAQAIWALQTALDLIQDHGSARRLYGTRLARYRRLAGKA